MAFGIDDAIMLGAMLALSAAMMVLSELLRPKTKMENARPSNLGDFKFPTATEGRPVPVIFGTVRLDGPNVIWYGDLLQWAMKKTIKTGLWSKQTMITGYKYYVGMQMGLCCGPIDAITRIWINDKEVWSGSVSSGPITIDQPTLFGGDDLGSGGISGTFRIFPGSTTQATSSYLAGFQSPLSAYRGTCYGIFERGYVGNSNQIAPWKIEAQRFPNALGLTGGKERVNTYDSNPMAVLYELLTDDEWGFGFSGSDVDGATLRTIGSTLYDEGNGFSFTLDAQRPASDLLEEIERQTDGVCYLDPQTGRWTFTIARGDYDVDTIRQLDATNVIAVSAYDPGQWDETSNQIRVGYVDRTQYYKDTFAQASDIANQRIQGGETIIATEQYPGVKSKDLAAQIANRRLSVLGRPVAKATIQVDRSFWDAHVGGVVAWTDAGLGLTKLPIRIVKIDYGTLAEGKIEIQGIEDVFGSDQATFAPPAPGSWIAPDLNVTGIPAEDQVIIEAPWAIERRDPYSSETRGRIWAGTRPSTGNDVSFDVYQRNSSGTPSGVFSFAGTIFGFFLIGKVRTTLAREATNPATLEVKAGDDDSIADILAVFSATSSADIGANLTNLILIGDEFMAPTAVVNHTTYISLTGCYRNLLDTVPQDHAADDPVYLCFVSGGLTDDSLPRGHNVHVKLRPRSRGDFASEGEATQVALTLVDRDRAPYPPTEIQINGSRMPTSASIDAGGGGLDTVGFAATFLRRDFRIFDETSQVLTDAAAISVDFPVANATQYRLVVGALFTTAWNAGIASLLATRTKILRATAGVLPTTLEVQVETRHVFDGETIVAARKLTHDFGISTSTLADDHNWGLVPYGTVSGTWVAPVSGTYIFDIGTAMPSGGAQARINGGGWVTVIAAGATTGNLPGVTATDTIEIQHLSSTGTSNETFLECLAPSGTVNSYAILIY